MNNIFKLSTIENANLPVAEKAYDTSFFMQTIKIKYTIKAKTIFTSPPAATIAILLGILALLKEPSFSERSSSPSILTNPPRGISLRAYLVCLPCFLHIVGPNPIANSFTLTLHNFATKKCPPSWIRTRKPSINIIFNIVIITEINRILSYNKNINKKYANGAVNITLSILSNIPPWPGIKLLKSLIPVYLFTLEAAKSPI